IFEKYINQKQMGAYYTREDITEYINRSTVLPFLFDSARAECNFAFESSSGTVWKLLSDDPERYIYSAVSHGAAEPPPDDIASGLESPALDQSRDELDSSYSVRIRNWNKRAPESHALPTETWREVIARRERYQELRANLAAGNVRDINDFVTLNLN